MCWVGTSLMSSAVSTAFSIIKGCVCRPCEHLCPHAWPLAHRASAPHCHVACRPCARRACCWRASTAAARGTAWGARASGAPPALTPHPPCPARRGRAPPHHLSRCQMMLPRLLFLAPQHHRMTWQWTAEHRQQLLQWAKALRHAAQAGLVCLRRQRHQVAACKVVEAMPR